ncbi:MAG: hypothetical protein U5K75_01930 [Ahrensia sp.]|nr:hypothetical protein [Ahrensia sp.]
MVKRNPDDESAREAERVLKRVAQESEVLGTSSFARTANKTLEHFAGADGDQEDKAEVWGKRVGRFLSLIVFIVLAIWLFNYLAN